MPHRYKLLTFLIASFMLVLLPSATALAEGKAPPIANSNFTMEGIERGCFPNDTSQGQEFYAHALITHEAGKTLQVTAEAETVDGEEVVYIGEIFVKSEEEHVGIRMEAAFNPGGQKGLRYIGPWAFATFNFYESGYKVGTGEGDTQFELCSEESSDHSPVIKGVATTTTQSGKPVLINVLEHASDPDGDGLEVIGISQPRIERGWSNDPSNGRVFIEGNQVRYTPPAQTRDYQVSFAYFVSDGKKGWSEGFAIVEVLEGTVPPKLPTAGEGNPQEESKAPPPMREVAFREENVITNNVTNNAVNPVLQEGTTPYELTISKKARISRNLLKITVTCNATTKCSGYLSLKLDKRTVSARKFAVDSGRHALSIKLSKSALKTLNKISTHRLKIAVSATCCSNTTVALEI